MAVYVSNLVLYTGTDFDQIFILEDNNSNSVLDLTGYTGSSQFKRYRTSSTIKTFEVSFPNRPLGKIKIAIGRTDTSDLKPGKYFYDLKITNPSGVTDRVVEGQITVKRSVTR